MDMACTTTTTSRSSSSLLGSCKHDVFLSFRGETRNNFTSHLYDALRRKKIEAYMDDKSLRSGEEISPALLKAIEDSKISIVLFSERYATSRWCLDELVHILECTRERGHVVFPVFYGVDPAHVRKQEETYAAAFVDHEERYKADNERVLRWRSALKEAGNVSGWHSRKDRPESELVDDIVRVTLLKLNSISSTSGGEVNSTPVGIEERFKKIEALLCVDSPDVRIVGIWGTGGMGKSTTAEFVQQQVSSTFETCFYANVGNEVKRRGVRYLVNGFYDTVLKEKDVDISNSFAEVRLKRAKVFVVLDNVHDVDQLERLIGVREETKSRFGEGSKFILISRDKKLLEENADDVYEIDELDCDEAHELFYQNAFRKDSSEIIDYVELSKSIVDYAGGNPVALKVLGTYLHSKSVKEWESALSKLRKGPRKKVLRALKISYDVQDRVKQSTLLGIACFLIKENKATLLEGISEDECISVLIKKCLLPVIGDSFDMLGLMQEMARIKNKKKRRKKKEKNMSVIVKLLAVIVDHFRRKKKKKEKEEGEEEEENNDDDDDKDDNNGVGRSGSGVGVAVKLMLIMVMVIMMIITFKT